VIVVTDRTVLDAQLQDTIYQFEHTDGVVGRINNKEGDGSKSESWPPRWSGPAHHHRHHPDLSVCVEGD
jgi:hypothetical protein